MCGVRCASSLLLLLLLLLLLPLLFFQQRSTNMAQQHDALVIKRIRNLFQVPVSIKITRWPQIQDSYKWFRGGGNAYSWFCSCRSCMGKNCWEPDSTGCRSVRKYTRKAFNSSVLFRCLEQNASVLDLQNPALRYIGVNSEEWIWQNGKPVLLQDERGPRKTYLGSGLL